MDLFQYINSFSLFGSEDGYKPGLKRIKRLLYYLSNPEKDLNFIHLAGTNAKGSTAAILERIYREAGYKTGLYSSPHFFHFNERIKVNGKAASSYQLQQIFAEIKDIVKKLKAENYAKPSFFEVVTAAAFKYFKQQEPDLVILETGLGGRLDATNIIEKNLLAVITNISLEHSQLLGETTAEIAAEKAAIIKKDAKTITAVKDPKALNLIQKKSLELNNKFIDLNKEYDLIRSQNDFNKNIVTLKRKNSPQKNYQISLLGSHQALNTALALRAVEELNKQFPAAEKDIKKALKDLYLAGRLEKILDKPAVIIDAAHNPAAFKELLSYLKSCSDQYHNLHFVLSILKDKDLVAVLDQFINYKIKPKFYLAENRSFRTIKIKDLEEKVKSRSFVYSCYNNIAEAVRAALKNAGKNDLITAAGSFNTIFETKIELMAEIRGDKCEKK